MRGLARRAAAGLRPAPALRHPQPLPPRPHRDHSVSRIPSGIRISGVVAVVVGSVMGAGYVAGVVTAPQPAASRHAVVLDAPPTALARQSMQDKAAGLSGAAGPAESGPIPMAWRKPV